MGNVKLLKSKIGTVQLRRAIQLFNKGDFVSSVTLAGAADEIFGQLAFRRQGHNTLDGDKWFFDGIAQLIAKPQTPKGKIKQRKNRIKNQLKHHDAVEDEMVEADFEFEAQELIDSAIRNYWIAFEKPCDDRIVARYVELHWT